MMVCSMCTGHRLNAHFARDLTLKRNRSQRYVGLVILVSQNKFIQLLMGPHIYSERMVSPEILESSNPEFFNPGVANL